MNPAMMNYLQSQQQSEQPQGAPQAQAPVFNPFDSGIRNAIESARVSLDMTEKQQDKAMRRSMLSFANAYSQEPRQKGFMANFGSVARSLSPAILEHDDAEDMAFKENNALANQILAHQAAEQNRQAQQEERVWHRGHAENQLAEQRRHHNMMSDYNQQKLNVQQGPSSPLTLNGTEVFPIRSKQELNAYTKDKKSLGTILNEVNELEADYTKFRKDSIENTFDTMGPASSFTNKAKDYLGRFFENKELKQETANLKTLDSKLNKFVISSERALKGGGIMGPRLIELFEEKGIYPDLKKDTPEIFESKLKMLKEEIENSYKAANLSLTHNVHIDPSQVKDLEKRATEEQFIPEDGIMPDSNYMEASQGGDIVIMQDAQGNKFQIPSNEAAEAINDGLTIVQE